MEFVYGGISLTFFTLCLLGTLWYKSRGLRRGQVSIIDPEDIPRNTEGDAEAEDFLGGVTDESAKEEAKRRQAFEEELSRMAKK